MQYAWLVWSALLLSAWLACYLLKKDLRRKMLIVSLWTMPLGLTEPLFVPQYWNPPSLFDLAARTGFDIESLIFAFAIGGLAAVLYQFVYPHHKHASMPAGLCNGERHRWHALILASPVLIFAALALLTPLDHIYCAIIGLFTGALATLYCRPDLKAKIWVGGGIFLLLYTIFFVTLLAIFPDFIVQVWNLNALLGISFLGVPIEEYLFAFTFGMLWASLYEHVFWLRFSA